MYLHVLKDPSTCPIKPSDIDSTRDFEGAFGTLESRYVAKCIVRYFQEKGKWGRFQESLIRKIAESEGYPSGHLPMKDILDRGFVVSEGRWYFVTIEFVGICYTASPNVEPVHHDRVCPNCGLKLA